jgi:hypothetical protein
MRDEAKHAAAKARSIARKLREQRPVDIVREEGRRIGLKEGLVREREIHYIDRGYDYLEGGVTVEIEDDCYFQPENESDRRSSFPRTTTPPPEAEAVKLRGLQTCQRRGC